MSLRQENDRAGDGPDETESYQYVRRLEAEHRHRNTLQFLGGLTRMKLRAAEHEETREALSYVSELIETLGALEDIASESACDDIADQLRGVSRHWQRLCGGSIRIELDAQKDIALSRSKRTIVVLIAQELVLNALKHAFPDRQTGTIRIKFGRSGDGHVTLVVDDDGVGVGENSAPAHSPAANAQPHGTTLVQSLSEVLGAQVERGIADDGAGYRVSVRWPQ